MMGKHEDMFRELLGIKIPEQKKLNLSSKETWNILKENLVRQQNNHQP